ncbi:MAG: MarR family transcriptional regulator [Lentisphaeria bacterium]|nr:MarR family transcriptional regulator [Lentisphaeria bacterium]NQZ67869.1 MarR family transcriptional regulator [Lentisphaeria bacterium]
MKNKIHEKLKQSKGFSSLSQEAVLGLLLLNEQLRQEMEVSMSPFDITPQQYNVLRILRGAGKDGLPSMSIGERMVEKTPGLTRLLDRLEKKSFVKRVHSTDDRRKVLCTIESKGLKLLKEMDRTVSVQDEMMFNTLTEKEKESLIRLINKALK